MGCHIVPAFDRLAAAKRAVHGCAAVARY